MGNTIRTTLLLGLLTGLLIAFGGLLGGSGGAFFALIFAIFMNFGSYWFSDKIALRMSGAREVSAQEEPEFHAMIDQLVSNANMPKPRVYIIDTDIPNAFATGRDPKHAAVAATTGIMRVLTRDELAGVMAHELAHVKHRDTLISAMAATVAGAITFMASMARWGLMFSGFGGRDNRSGGDIISALILALLAPVAAALVQMAISRTREYSADRGGAEILGDARPLASALMKIENYVQGRRQPSQVNPATAHMYIINPLKGGMAGLFSTHPPTAERIERLHKIAEEQGHVMLG